MSTPTGRPWRLFCAGFSEADRASLGSLMGLLAPYLRMPWELVDTPARADLCLVRLDGEASSTLSHARLVGCAQHPRQHAPGTLHRPLRAAQLLALLSETGAELATSKSASASAPMPAPHAPTERVCSLPLLRLLAWPLDAEDGPPLRLQALAALSAGATTTEALAECIGATVGEIEAITEALSREGLLTWNERSLVTVRSPPPAPPGWRGFMAGLGRRLGLFAS